MPNEPPESSSWGFERIVPDGIKRAVLAGVGTLFMSEEGIRSVLGDLKLPKEVAQFILNQAAKIFIFFNIRRCFRWSILLLGKTLW